MTKLQHSFGGLDTFNTRRLLSSAESWGGAHQAPQEEMLRCLSELEQYPFNYGWLDIEYAKELISYLYNLEKLKTIDIEKIKMAQNLMINLKEGTINLED